MRFSALHVFLCLAASVIASPTTFNPDSLEARDAWTSPARRGVFDKREALVRRESNEILARELEELAQREEEELEKRNFEDLRARYFEGLAKREWKEFATRDIESRKPLSFNALSKRDPQFNIGSFITNLRTQLANGRFGANATANANTGTGTGTGTGTTTNTNTGFGGFANLGGGLGGGVSNRISSALSRLGFNFRRGEFEELVERSPEPFPFGFGSEDDGVARRAPFELETFVKSKRGEIVE
ncbi:hypothetical protein PENSPDRAFT_668893 [Peniophora sp. CONT]|nr:hypothetical protein PENSPDRAFT_668893 [Peniophora sp. CONT]